MGGRYPAGIGGPTSLCMFLAAWGSSPSLFCALIASFSHLFAPASANDWMVDWSICILRKQRSSEKCWWRHSITNSSVPGQCLCTRRFSTSLSPRGTGTFHPQQWLHLRGSTQALVLAVGVIHCTCTGSNAACGADSACSPQTRLCVNYLIYFTILPPFTRQIITCVFSFNKIKNCLIKYLLSLCPCKCKLM